MNNAIHCELRRVGGGGREAGECLKLKLGFLPSRQNRFDRHLDDVRT